MQPTLVTDVSDQCSVVYAAQHMVALQQWEEVFSARNTICISRQFTVCAIKDEVPQMGTSWMAIEYQTPAEERCIHVE